MTFREGVPIFLQIVESLEDRILKGELAADDRLPAVRDIALALEVNPNTVVRSFQELESSGVLFKKRGLGCFVAPHARARILERRRRAFLEVELPAIARTMRLLEIPPSALTEAIARHEAQASSDTKSQGTPSS